MKVRELIERLQTMEQDATVTVRASTLRQIGKRVVNGVDEVRVDGIEQHGAGFNATVQLDTEDELKLA